MSVKVLKKVRFHSARPMEQLQRVAEQSWAGIPNREIQSPRPLLSLAATSLPSSSISLSEPTLSLHSALLSMPGTCKSSQPRQLYTCPPGVWCLTFWIWTSPLGQVSGHVSAQFSSLSSLPVTFLCFFTVSTLHDDVQLVVGFSMTWFQTGLDKLT